MEVQEKNNFNNSSNNNLNNIFTIDFFQNINSYKPNLSISQVIIFFERNEIIIPKTTIQNFVRCEVVSEVVDKRYYTKTHILEIIIAMMYKDTFSLSNIKVLNKLINDECDNIGIDNVFYAIYNVNNNLCEYVCNGSYLDIIYNMTSAIVFKNNAISMLSEES